MSTIAGSPWPQTRYSIWTASGVRASCGVPSTCTGACGAAPAVALSVVGDGGVLPLLQPATAGQAADVPVYDQATIGHILQHPSGGLLHEFRKRGNGYGDVVFQGSAIDALRFGNRFAQLPECGALAFVSRERRIQYQASL